MANPFTGVREHRVSIKKMNNKWKSVDARDSSKTAVKCRVGEKVIWDAEESDLYFQFMDETLFGVYTTSIKRGDSLTLTVDSRAKRGTHPYAVFCLSDKEFAEGNSPPKIIIE